MLLILNLLFFYSIFRTTPEVSSELYFVEICQVLEKLWLFDHKIADFWPPNFGFKRSLLNLLNQGGHKPGKHGKPGKRREIEKLSKSQGKLREI